MSQNPIYIIGNEALMKLYDKPKFIRFDPVANTKPMRTYHKGYTMVGQLGARRVYWRSERAGTFISYGKKPETKDK
jgi:hypothetical protein